MKTTPFHTYVHPDYEGGKSISALTCHMDLAPTFVDMASLLMVKRIFAEILREQFARSDERYRELCATALFLL